MFCPILSAGVFNSIYPLIYTEIHVLLICLYHVRPIWNIKDVQRAKTDNHVKTFYRVKHVILLLLVYQDVSVLMDTIQAMANVFLIRNVLSRLIVFRHGLNGELVRSAVVEGVQQEQEFAQQVTIVIFLYFTPKPTFATFTTVQKTPLALV